jgi:hypothetical protein
MVLVLYLLQKNPIGSFLLLDIFTLLRFLPIYPYLPPTISQFLSDNVLSNDQISKFAAILRLIGNPNSTFVIGSLFPHNAIGPSHQPSRIFILQSRHTKFVRLPKLNLFSFSFLSFLTSGNRLAFS